MDLFDLYLLMGAPQGDGASAGGGLMSILMFIPIIAIFYFLIIRPQRKKQKETDTMLKALKKGDRIVTIGGIHGTIQTVRTNTVIVRVDEGVKLEFSRSAISSVVEQANDDEEEEAEETKKVADSGKGGSDDKAEKEGNGGETDSKGTGTADSKKPEQAESKMMSKRRIITMVVLLVVAILGIVIYQAMKTPKNEPQAAQQTQQNQPVQQQEYRVEPVIPAPAGEGSNNPDAR